MLRIAILVTLTLSIAFWSQAARASVVTDAIVLDANKLVTGQSSDGSWATETNYTGPIAAGLVDAYNYTGNAAYKTAAQNAGGYIVGLSTSQGLEGDEAYALTRISAIQPDPNSNVYRTAAQNFFSNVQSQSGGTQDVIDRLVSNYAASNDHSQAVIYLAYYTAAADVLNATDKTIWRNGLINTLGQVDNSDSFPVGALGAAVWALAQTGNGLSAGTTLSGSSTFLNNKTLADLPALLAGEMEPSGLKAGTFYWNFAQTDGGYTEDTAMGLMGLDVAYAANSSLNYGSLLAAGRSALAASIGDDGSAYWDIGHDAPVMNLFGGRALEAMAVPEPSSALLLSASVLCMIGRRRLRKQH